MKEDGRDGADNNQNGCKNSQRNARRATKRERNIITRNPDAMLTPIENEDKK